MTTPKTYTAAEVEQMKADAVREAMAKRLTVKISPKGGIQVNGLQKWPVTLYRSQWEALLGSTVPAEGSVLAQVVALYPKAKVRE